MARRKRKESERNPRRRRGTGSVTRIASGWRARLPTQPDGSRPAHDCATREQAEAWLIAMLVPQPEPTAAPLTVREWGGEWLAAYVKPIRAPTTYRRYRHSLRLLEPLYATALTALTSLDLQRLVGELLERLDASTVQDAVGVWRRCFQAAVNDGYMPRNPAAALVPPSVPPKGTGRHVTKAEVDALWPAIRGHRFEGGFALLIGCGLRIGEVLGLHWKHVDLDRRRAWIQHQWTDHHMRDLPKGKVARWVRLPIKVVDALGRHRQGQPDDAVLVMQSPHPGRKHKGRPPAPGPHPWSSETVRTDLVAVAEAASIDPFAPHATRRGLVSALLDGKVSPAAVAERVGHANAGTTLRHYAGVSPEARLAADAVIDAYLGPDDDDLVSGKVCSDG